MIVNTDRDTSIHGRKNAFISMKMMISNYFFYFRNFIKAQEAFECLKQLWDDRNSCILRNIEELIRDIHLIGEQHRLDGSFWFFQCFQGKDESVQLGGCIRRWWWFWTISKGVLYWDFLSNCNRHRFFLEFCYQGCPNDR